ncbi:MAG TPA: cytochrome P450 [Blastocatellia bacterium]|nr:cytochrome P450 [Blastocatellia bacterium]
MSSVISTPVSVPPLPPGPKGNFILGVMRDYQRDQFGFVERCASEYGDIVRMKFLYVHSVFIFHPDLIEAVLVTNQRNFIKPASMRTPFMRRLVGNGLLTSEGDFWKRQRRLAQPAFHRERVNAYGRVMVEFAERMTAAWRPGETRDAHQDMMKLTLEIVAKTLFDADITGRAGTVGDALSIAVEPFSEQATFKWMLDNRLPTPGNRRFHRAVGRLDEIIFDIISERRRSGEDRGDLLSMLLMAQDTEEGGSMSDRQLRDEAMTIFLAGHETTALALSWSWYLLSQHPEAEAKLHAELESVLGGRAPGVANLPALRYTEMIVKETMRLYPPAWAVGRAAVEDCEIGGWHIPARSQIYMFQWVVQRDPRFFDRPDEFIPGRWTEEFTKQLPRYAYFPFGGGPRLCIGNSFALMEAVLLLATVAQKFRLKLVPGQTIRPVPSITLRPEQGIKVLVEKR